MIKVPGRGRLTLAKAFDLLRELDWYAGSRSGNGHTPIACIDKTRAALAEYIAQSLATRDARAERRS